MPGAVGTRRGALLARDAVKGTGVQEQGSWTSWTPNCGNFLQMATVASCVFCLQKETRIRKSRTAFGELGLLYLSI